MRLTSLFRVVLLVFFASVLISCGPGLSSGDSWHDPDIPKLTRDTGFWYDMTGRVSYQTDAEFEALSARFEKHGYQFAGIIFSKCAGEPKTVANEIINVNGIGYAEKNNGVAIAVFLDQYGSDGKAPALGVGTGKGFEKLLTEERLLDLLNRTYIPLRKEGKWEEGVLKFGDILLRFLDDPELAEFAIKPVSLGFWGWFAIGLCVLFAVLIVVAVALDPSGTTLNRLDTIGQVAGAAADVADSFSSDSVGGGGCGGGGGASV